MFNLKTIIELLAVIAIIISLWAIQYFIARIIVVKKRWLSPDRERELRDEKQLQNLIRHSPTDKNLRS